MIVEAGRKPRMISQDMQTANGAAGWWTGEEAAMKQVMTEAEGERRNQERRKMASAEVCEEGELPGERQHEGAPAWSQEPD